MLREVLSAAIFLASTALARPCDQTPRSSLAGADIEFCTQSSYSTGACPYAQPTSGAGTCGTLTVEAGTCYTFDDFPDAPSELIGAVNYISIPGGTSISGCNLYKTLNCTVTPDQEWDACEVGSTDLTCRKHLAATITSWVCS